MQERKLKFTEAELKDVFIIEPKSFVDERGSFDRLFCAREFGENGLNTKLVQINHSKSLIKGIVRGLHYQIPPNAETKVIKCVKGSIFDVVVDVRKDSPTFLKWFGLELSRENKKMVYVPWGFAHGFQALDSEVEVIYFATGFYSPEDEKGIRYNDPKVGIKWKLNTIVVSNKDANIPLLDDNFKGIKL